MEGGIQMFTFTSSKKCTKETEKTRSIGNSCFMQHPYLFFPHFIPFHWGMHSSKKMAWKHQLSWDLFLFQLHQKQRRIVGTCRECPQVGVANKAGEINQTTTTSLSTKQNCDL
jgi:hypothetical protein